MLAGHFTVWRNYLLLRLPALFAMIIVASQDAGNMWQHYSYWLVDESMPNDKGKIFLRQDFFLSRNDQEYKLKNICLRRTDKCLRYDEFYIFSSEFRPTTPHFMVENITILINHTMMWFDIFRLTAFKFTLHWTILKSTNFVCLLKICGKQI